MAAIVIGMEHWRTARGMKKTYALRKKAEKILIELACCEKLLHTLGISKRDQLFLLRESERLRGQLDTIHFDASHAWNAAQRNRSRAKGLAHLITFGQAKKRKN